MAAPDLARSLDDNALLRLVRDLSESSPSVAERVLTASAPSFSMETLEDAIDAALQINEPGASALALAELLWEQTEAAYPGLQVQALNLARRSGNEWIVGRFSPACRKHRPRRPSRCNPGIEEQEAQFGALTAIKSPCRTSFGEVAHYRAGRDPCHPSGRRGQEVASQRPSSSCPRAMRLRYGRRSGRIWRCHYEAQGVPAPADNTVARAVAPRARAGRQPRAKTSCAGFSESEAPDSRSSPA